MHTVTVSEKGQVVIPAEIRRKLGITPGYQLDFTVEGSTIRVELRRRVKPTRPEESYGMLACKKLARRQFFKGGRVRE
jgi:antitoxin PrlF